MSAVELLPPEMADRISERLVRFSAPVLTKSEAMVLVGVQSSQAFDRWMKRTGVRPVGHGRYARHKILIALETEAGLRKARKAKAS